MTKSYLQLLFIGLIFFNIPTNIHAQVPSNDECADAISLTLGTQISGTNVGATASLTEVDAVTGLGILAVCNPPNGFGIENAVWYEFTVENEGNHTLSLTNTACALSYAVYPVGDISCDNIFQSTLNGDQAFCVALGPGSDSTVMVMEEGSYYLIIDGAGGVSCDFNLEVFEGPVCSPPDDVEAEAGSTSAELSWESEGFAFNIEWGATGFPQGVGTLLSTTDNPYNLEGLTPLTTYDFYVQADCGAEGISDWVGPFTFTTLQPAPVCGGQFYDVGGPDNPYPSDADEVYNICPDNAGEAVTVTFTFVDIESANSATSNGTGCWDYMSIYNGADTNSAFLGDFCNAPDATGSGLPLSAGDSFIADNPSGCLTFTFTSDGSVQNGGWAANVTCAEAESCPEPTDLTANNITDTSAAIGWNSGTILFDVEWGETGFAPGTGTMIPEVGNPANLTNLTPETTYDYYVCAICPDGMGGTTTSECVGPFTFTTTAPPCFAPSALFAEDITDSSAELSWNADTDNFNIEWGETGFAQGTGTGVNSINFPYNLSGLSPETSYDYYACTICDNGSEECTGPFTFITAAAPPSCTSGLFYDNGGSLNSYTPNSNDVTTICPDNLNEAITVTFTLVDIETSTGSGNQNGCWDYLSIYNGMSAFNPLQETACGELDGDGGTPSVAGSLLQAGDSFTSTHVSGCLTFVFTSDGSIQGAGWEATVTCAPAVECPDGLGLSTTSSPESGVGANDGSIDLSVNGEGTAPYTYAWSNSVIGQDVVNLAAGVYCVTVTDANGCTDSICENVTSACADDWEFDAIVEYESGGGMNDGSIDISISGGIPPYTYAWNTGATSQDLSGLSGGTYTVLVTDVTGCTQVYEIFIGTDCPEDFNIIGQVMDMEIGLMNGAIDITVNGGTPPYTYSWSNSANTEDISGLAPGDYSVVVTDAVGCNDAFVATIEAVCPYNLGITSEIIDESALGAGDGTIDITVNGGTPPYLYSWNIGENTQDISGLGAGSYCVIVFDSGGCTANLCFNIGEGCADELISNIEVTDETATGDNDGEIDIDVFGGNPIYTYIWDNGSTNADQLDLAAGTYCLTVTDGLGCMQATCVEVGTFCPQDFGITADITNESIMLSADGEIDITVNGGVPPYAYFWSNGQGTEDVIGLAPGEYCVRVTDAEACIDNVCFTIEEGCPPNFVTVVDIQDVSVSGLMDGSINQILVNGTPPYTFDWSTGEMTEDISGLGIGIYTVTIVDAEGCMEIAEYEIDPETCPELITGVDITQISTMGNNDGAIDLTTNAGAQPLTFQWSNGASTEDIDQLAADRYFITITDAAGCTTQTFFDLDEPVSINNIDALTNVQLLPNPAQDQTQLNLTFDRNVDVQISIINIVGQVLDQRTQHNISNTQFIFNLENYAEGVYFIRIEADGQQFTRKLMIND